MKKYYQAELAVYIRREKEIEKELAQLEEDFETWKERVQLAEKAGRPQLRARAEQRLDELRADAWGLRSELKDIIKKKREIRMDSRRPSGVETRRAQSLLKSFRESGIIDPDEAQLQEEIAEAAKDDDAALEALKVKAGMQEAPAEEPVSAEEPAPEPEPDDDLDAELAALRAKMGVDDGGGEAADDDVDLDELERMLADDDDGDADDGDEGAKEDGGAQG